VQHAGVAAARVSLAPCIEFDHGTITRRRAKECPGNSFVGDPSLMKLLRAWHEHCGRPGLSESIVRDVGPEAAQDQAKLLRADLSKASINRPVLTSASPEVEPLCFHDMRATIVTWARRAGKPDGWIAERTGHVTKKMLDRYTQQALTLAGLGYEPFPDVSLTLRELAELVASTDAAARGWDHGPGWRCQPIGRITGKRQW
jgi:integrase